MDTFTHGLFSQSSPYSQPKGDLGTHLSQTSVYLSSAPRRPVRNGFGAHLSALAIKGGPAYEKLLGLGTGLCVPYDLTQGYRRGHLSL